MRRPMHPRTTDAAAGDSASAAFADCAAELAPGLAPDLAPDLTPMPRAFFARDPRTVARELLGKLLVRLLPASAESQDAPVLLAGRIVEAEAYLGPLDPAAHTYRGQTLRNAVLFGPPGYAYIYLIYGNHYCTNVSCQREGEPGGVLLRALEPVCGIPAMATLRKLTLPDNASAAGFSQNQLRNLTSGPGRLSQALGITRAAHNGCDLCDASSGLYIAQGLLSAPGLSVPGSSTPAPGETIIATRRINVPRAPHQEWRYVLAGNPFVSGPRSR